MEKPPKDVSATDKVTPIERGYKIRFDKIRAKVGKIVEQQVDSYDRLTEAREGLQELLDAEMALPENKRDAGYIDRLKDGLEEVEDGMGMLDAWFKKAKAVEEEFAKKAEVMTKAEEVIRTVMQNVEDIKRDSREGTKEKE